MRELYFEVMDFLDIQYGRITDWLCKRTLLCLHSGQYFIKRDADGVSTYCGWFLVDNKDIVAIAGLNLAIRTIEDVTQGNTVWVIDAASRDRVGIRECQKLLRARYPQTSGVRGIAWLRENKRLVSSPRQKGAHNELDI